MNLSDIVTADFYRLVEFEDQLREAFESNGNTMSDTALIVPVTQAGPDRYVSLGLRHALGINVTSPDEGVIRLSHAECEGDRHDSDCVLAGIDKDMSTAEAIHVLLRLMTVASVLETAADIARDILNDH